jgi:hypothetical protein
MKIKLDENMPLALAELLRFHGHDCSTVPEEHLSGVEDFFEEKNRSSLDLCLDMESPC